MPKKAKPKYVPPYVSFVFTFQGVELIRVTAPSPSSLSDEFFAANLRLLHGTRPLAVTVTVLEVLAHLCQNHESIKNRLQVLAGLCIAEDMMHPDDGERPLGNTPPREQWPF